MNEEPNILEEIDNLRKDIKTYYIKVKPNESNELNELYGALSKAQAEMEVAKLDSTNPFYKSKYADLPSVVRASRVYLSKNGLSVIQRLVSKDSKNYLFTRLCHASGQWIESQLEINPPKPGIQELGKEITYLRRYMYASICGVVAADEDDDGESAMQNYRKEEAAERKDGRISKAQLQVLSGELEGEPDLLESILKGYKISKLSDLPEKVYTPCLNKIKEIKRAKE